MLPLRCECHCCAALSVSVVQNLGHVLVRCQRMIIELAESPDAADAPLIRSQLCLVLCSDVLSVVQ